MNNAIISFRLFTSVDEAVWQIGTIPLFRALLALLSARRDVLVVHVLGD